MFDFLCTFSALPQAISLPLSYISLALASAKLFYSQRLGCLSIMEPSLKMIFPVFVLALLMLLGPLLCLSLFASYFPKAVFLPILITISLQFTITKMVYFWKDKNAIIEQFYANKYEHGTKECHLIMGISAMTSWIAPCTVWINRKLPGKQKHLIVSSLLTVSAYLMTLLSLGLLAANSNLNEMENPPVLHCFRSGEGFADKFFHFSQNTSWWNLIVLTTVEASPKIRICSNSEDPAYMLTCLLIVIACIFSLTQITSIFYHYMSNYSAVHKYLGCAKSFMGSTIEILFQAQTSG